MKIAVFYNLPFSGAKRTVQEHVKGLKTLKNEIDVYTLNKNDDLFSPENYADNYFSYIYQRKKINFPFLRKISEDLSDFIFLKKLHKKIAQDIDEKKYDIVLVHTDHFTQAPFLLRYLKTKSVYFCLEPLKMVYEYGLRIDDNLSVFNKFYETLNRNIRKKIDRENAQSAKNSFAISLFGRELMISAFDMYPKISYLGINDNLFRRHNLKKKNQVLFVGQKLDINGYQYAQEAIKKIPKNIRPTLKVLSIGKGKKISDQDLVKLYNESLVTLCLSNYDTFGLVTLESMSCGTPVIAFNVAGYREIIENQKTGILVDFSSDEIASQIMNLKKDDQLYHNLSENAEKSVFKNWTWNKHITKLNNELITIYE